MNNIKLEWHDVNDPYNPGKRIELILIDIPGKFMISKVAAVQEKFNLSKEPNKWELEVPYVVSDYKNFNTPEEAKSHCEVLMKKYAEILIKELDKLGE